MLNMKKDCFVSYKISGYLVMPTPIRNCGWKHEQISLSVVGHKSYYYFLIQESFTMVEKDFVGLDSGRRNVVTSSSSMSKIEWILSLFPFLEWYTSAGLPLVVIWISVILGPFCVCNPTLIWRIEKCFTFPFFFYRTSMAPWNVEGVCLLVKTQA